MYNRGMSGAPGALGNTGRAARVHRRSQEERSASTRLAIVEATSRCLIRFGYSGTTVAAVAEEAGVSRGALTHHFATKQEMLISAIDQFSERAAADLRAASGALDDSGERVRQTMRLLWQSFVGDLFAAALEMWIAARTDPALMDALLESERSLGARNRALMTEMFGTDIADAPGFDLALDMTFNLMRGVAVTGILRQSVAREIQLVDAWTYLFMTLIATPVGVGSSQEEHAP